MNENKIAFIICTNNQLYFNECCYYINRLFLPEGFERDVIGIEGAPSMCAGYNAGMQSSDAKYKIYLHHDVFIKEPKFIFYLLERFRSAPDVGMIGMVGGCGMPKTGVAYLAWNEGTVDCREPDFAYQLICDPAQQADCPVDAVDGLLIATQYDVAWREDLFVNFDFYDVSQSFEMRKAGYHILVPYQKTPWVIHDSSFAKLNHYDENRKIALETYPDFFTEEDGFSFVYEEEWENLSEVLADEVRRLIDVGNWEDAGKIVELYHKNQMKNSALELYGVMCEIYEKEQECGIKEHFFDKTGGYEAAYQKYMTVRFLLRRVECEMESAAYSELKDAVVEGRISAETLLLMILHGSYDKATVLRKVIPWCEAAGDNDGAQKLQAFYDRVKGKKLPFAYSKRVSVNQ